MNANNFITGNSDCITVKSIHLMFVIPAESFLLLWLALNTQAVHLQEKFCANSSLHCLAKRMQRGFGNGVLFPLLR